MKLIIVFMVSLLWTTRAASIAGDNVITNASSNSIGVTTQKIITTNISIDEISSKEVEEINSLLQVLNVQVNDDTLQMCIDNNDSFSFEIAKGADDQLDKCFLPVINSAIELLSGIESYNSDLFKNMSSLFCKTYPDIQEKCLNKYYNSIQPCLSLSDMRGIRIYYEMLNAAAEYLCQYDIDFLIEAAQNEFGCTWHHVAGLVFCIVPPFQELIRYNNTSLAVPRTLVGKGCRLHKKMTQCIQEEFNSCKNSSYSDVIVGLFNATTKALPECPSEIHELGEQVGEVLKNLLEEEHVQTDLLKQVKAQIDALVATNTDQNKVLDEIKRERKKENDILNSILNHFIEKHNAVTV